MNKTELLAEAKKRFPIGTVFLDAAHDDQYTVKKYDDHEGDNGWHTDKYIIIYVENITGCGKYLYLDGKWAEVVSYPEGYVPECPINNSFPIY